MDSHVDIPSEINGVEVKAIGDNAFAWNTVVTSVHIPNAVKAIGRQSFRGTAIKEIDLPSSVESLSWHSFLANANLEKVTIPSTVKELDSSHLFDRAHGVKEMNFNASIDVLPGYTFFELGRDSGGVESLILPDSIKTVGYGSLQTANTKHVKLGAQVESISGYAFWKNQAKTIEIPSTIKEVSIEHSLRSSTIETYVLYSDKYLTNYADYIDMLVAGRIWHDDYDRIDKELMNLVIYDTKITETNDLDYVIDKKKIIQLDPKVEAGLLSIEGTQKGEIIETPEHVDLSTIDTSLVWTSADETIASVDESGRVTGVKNGTTTITASSVWNPAKTVSYEVTVKLGNYEVSFCDGDTEVKTVQIVEGSKVEIPQAPTKESDDQYTYEFDQWVPQGDYSLEDLNSVSQDMKFVSSYKAVALQIEQEDKGEVLGETIENEIIQKEIKQEVKNEATHSQPSVVQTFDTTVMGIYIVVLVLSGVILLVYKKKFDH